MVATTALPQSSHSATERAVVAARAERFASQLHAVCREAELVLRESVAARDAQQIAWLVLCDRGWPRDAMRTVVDSSLTNAWLSAWCDHVALPVRLTAPRDLVELRRIRRRLEHCESALRPELPKAVWKIVDPLDDTGRSTLAYVLHALVGWTDATAACEASSRRKARVSVRFSLFAHQAQLLRLAPPRALLDLDGWRELIAEATRLAAIERGTSLA